MKKKHIIKENANVNKLILATILLNHTESFAPLLATNVNRTISITEIGHQG